VQSMTGFGRGAAMCPGRELTVELRSVNHRFLDLSFRMPRSLGFAEDAVRGIIAKGIERGHVDIYVSLRETAPITPQVHVDLPLAQALRQAANDIGGEVPTPAQLMALPQVVQLLPPVEDEEPLLQAACEATQQAVTALLDMRRREGAALCGVLAEQLDALEGVVSGMDTQAPQVRELLYARVRERVEALLGEAIEPARLAQEAAILADKAAVDEELARLRAHIVALRELLSQEGQGKRMDFLIQELHREVNTTGSKSQGLELTRLVLEGKSIVEKLREQVQNLA